MLIIPIENKPNWARPPFVTLALILLNVLVFVFYQGDDDEVLEQAASVYEKHELLAIERSHYLDYLKTERFSEYVELVQLPEAQQDDALFWSILYDRGFDQYLSDVWRNHEKPDTETVATWREARREFQQQRDQLSSVAAGLTPAERKPWTFFTSMFLHGGVDHLLGNMVFLFLFGFALEGALNRATYLGMYLTSGLAANALFVVLNTHSYIPLIGASGAVSGLMGMYLALYRLRRIRFFYTVIFYFGEFRAPAILVLPLWLAKELYGHFFLDSSTAYWAHIGGLLAGTGLMLLTPGSRQQFEKAQEAKELDDDLTKGLKDVQLAVSRLNYDRARSLAQMLCERYQEDPRPWRTLFDLYKTQPRQKALHETVFKALKQFSQPKTLYAEWVPHVTDIIEEYTAKAPATPALTGNLCLALARKYWRNHGYGEAVQLIKRAQENGANSQLTLQLLTEMHRHYQKNRQAPQAEQLAASIRLLQKPIPRAAE